MSQIVSSQGVNPLDVIFNNTSAKTAVHMDRFRGLISEMYKYNIFRDMLDLTATKALQSKLTFIVEDKKFYHLDSGNCKSIETGVFDKVLNTFRRERKYCISIKKIDAAVLMHEIGHMIEFESAANLNNPDFIGAFKQDFAASNTTNVMLKSTLREIMHDGLKHYPESEHRSELFARFFELCAMSKEIAGLSITSGYGIVDVMKYFENVIKWMEDKVYSSMRTKVDPAISTYSFGLLAINPLTINLNETKPKWSGSKVHSIHPKSSGPAWKNTVKSIKDDQ